MKLLSPATYVAALACVLAGAPRLSATSYPPISFDELVTYADVIFVGEVVDVRPYTLSTRDGDIIKTRVVFRVADPLHGTASALESFDFLGGEIDGVVMRVAEMPRFTIGDRRVVFARRSRSINPIVGFTQGLMRVDRDTFGVERVGPSDGTARSSALASPRLADLRARIVAKVAEVKR